MKRQAYQHPELRDENDNIIQEGTYGKEAPLVNSTNDGVLDYINNNLEALHDAQMAAGNAITTGTLTVTGKTTTGTLAAGDTTVTGTITTTGLTVTGETSVPTANEGNSSNAIASTEFVAKSISALVNGAPGQLNTLNELAKALGNDSNFSATITAELAKKLNSNEAESTYATKTEVGGLSGTIAPTGVVQAFAGRTTPQGWLLCDGSAVSRTDYAALYAVIGTTYGAGDSSTTFNLPNLVDKFVEGSATSGTVKSAGLPNIKGQWGLGAWGSGDVFSGASTQNNAINVKTAYLDTGTAGIISFDASKSNPIYGSSTTVQPPALTMRYIIKY